MNAAGPDDTFDIVADAGRLREIEELGILTGDADEILMEIAGEAARRIGMPISLVSIVLDEAQFFAAAHGLEGWLDAVRGTPVEWSFCANAVRSGEPFVVEDALTHPVTRENPLVLEDGIRCYAGVPLISSRGFSLGTLCVLGKEQRSFGDDDMLVLRECAKLAVERIEGRRGDKPVD